MALRAPLRRAALALALALAPALAGCGEAPPRRDVLIVSFDTLRADRLGAYGNDDWGVTTSPHVDALAARGVLFENALAPRGQTHPSLAAMLTGKYPITTGVRDNGLLLLPEHRTIFERLRAEGFRTGVFVANFDRSDARDDWVFRGAELEGDGFDGRFASEVRDRGRSHAEWDDRVEAAALRFLDGARDDRRPFAAWVHFYDVHQPFDPPPGYVDRYGLSPGLPEVLRAPASGRALERHLRAITLGEREVPAAELRRILGLYDGTITATDARLGRLLARLEATGRLASTVLVFTSDHGEELFDRNRYFNHGNSVYQGVLRIPLVIAGPGLPAGGRVPALVQNVDLAPTLLDLLGLPPAGEMEGRSLAPLLRGETTAPPRPHAFSEWQDLVYAVTDGVHSYVHNPRHAHPLKAPYRVKRGERATRGYEIDCFEAYDLRTDPREQRDVLAGRDPATLGEAASLPGEIAPLRRALDAWLADPRHEREMSWPGHSPENDARLEALGYVAAGARQRKDVLFREPCGG